MLSAGPVSVRIGMRTTVVSLILLAAAIVAGLVSLTFGEVPLSVGEVASSLVGLGDQATQFIVVGLRLPRLLLAMLVGMALGVGGAVFQSLSRNPLGSPDIVGFNHGAAAGALVAILVLGLGSVGTSIAAIIAGCATAGIVYLLAFKRGVQGYRLVLIGIAVGAALASVNQYLLTRADVTDAQQAAIWITGSLNGRDWPQVIPMVIALVVTTPALMALSRSLTLLEMGDDAANALGVRVEPARLALILLAVGLTAVATSVAGPIVFVALAAPQLAKRLTRAAGPGVLPAALMGGLLLVVSDLAAQRLLGLFGLPIELPVGVATGATGGIYLMWLLAREWKAGRG